LFSGLSKHSTNPVGNEEKASSDGAKTVKGPLGLDKASVKSAAERAAAKVVKDPASTAVCTMSLSGLQTAE